MSKEEPTSSSRGLLSKVVRFVRNPTVNWSDLDSLDEERESQYSRQALKEMIERKRRNDFVRRREFDHLRKLRSREGAPGDMADVPGVPSSSFFQNSTTSSGERADTLRKIDEIEQQMSQQWWKGKPGAGAPAGARPPENAAPSTQPQPPSPAASAMAAALASSPFASSEHARAFAPTAPLSLSPAIGPEAAGAPPAAPAPDALLPELFAEPPAAPAGSQGPVAPPAHRVPTAALTTQPPVSFVHDPQLEEAAILFAHADYAGAEAALRELLAPSQSAPDGPAPELWHTLFDLYRATGQQEPFEALAIDYAALFGRTGPLWFSMPRQLGLQVPQAPAGLAGPASAARELNWNAPAVLTASSLSALQASLARAAPPWSLAWGRLSQIEPAAVPVLAEQFERWAGQQVQLRFTGMPALLGVVQAQTPSGERSRDPQGWRLRMALLRLMGRVDEFDLVALNYCVTYEVSPPSWEAPRCGFDSDDDAVPAPAEAGPESDFSVVSGFALSQLPGMEDQPVPALVGHIEGDASEALAQVEALARPGLPLVVACGQLIRTDFAAGGGVLNWAAGQQGLGQQVRFVELHRLLAVFFNVIGINEHASVSVRKD